MPKDRDISEEEFMNPDDAVIDAILKKSRVVAVVGLSNNEERASHQVAHYLQRHGYSIVPVNPAVDEVLGEKAYPDLLSIPFPVDIVDIFRKREAIPAIVDEALKIDPSVIWMQLGLHDESSAERARKEGITVIQSRCIKIEHTRMSMGIG